jgi:hypothetical protein
MPIARYSFSLDAIKNAYVMRRLEQEVSISDAVRRALEAYYSRPSHQDIDAKLDEVLECLRGVQVVSAGNQAGAGTEDAEPAKARRGLNEMRRRFRQKDLGLE